MSLDRPDRPEEAETLFAEWAVRAEAGEPVRIEELLDAYPGHKDALTRLHEDWKFFAPLLGRAVPGRISEASGIVLAPITSHGRGDAEGPSPELIERLGFNIPDSGRYRFRGVLGRGGGGVVLRVWDTKLNRALAMKVVLGRDEERPDGNTPKVDSRTLSRFVDEARIASQLNHPGIVPVHELGTDESGRAFFTMKLVTGEDLAKIFEHVKTGHDGWNQTRALNVLLRVCESLAFAHERGVIHRDLKPANIMVGRHGEVYVMDWGLARVLGEEDKRDVRVKPPSTSSALLSVRGPRPDSDEDSPLYTMDGDVIGTPAYMAPEQAAGRLDLIGQRSDVYAVGAMLYHLLSGHLPYVPDGAQLNNYAVLQRVQQGPPEPLHDVAPLVPAELGAICEKSMARDATARYADSLELAADLAAYIESRVVHAYEMGAWAEARKWVQRNKALAGAVAAAALLLVVGLVSSLALKAQSDTNAERADATAEEARLNAQRADAKAREAEQNLIRAQEQQRLAEAQTAKVLRLSDVKVLQELEAEADSLWPAYPDRIPALESWVERARALAANLPGHRATLAEMRRKAHAWTDEQRTQDRASHPRAAELAETQAELDGLIAQMEQGLTGEAQEKADERVTVLEPEVAALAAEVASRKSWQFDTPEEDWQHSVLAELIGNLERLEVGLLAEDATTADHGWSLPKRLAFARDLEAGFGEGGEYAAAWALALPAISAAYPGLDLKPHMGLVPIGADPASGLWEFAHLMTGVPAERSTDEKLLIREESGLVMALVPGSTFLMGAQSSSSTGANYDRECRSYESPVHEVTLSPYFLSKYEMTQGQWKRTTGCTPSVFGASTYIATWNRAGSDWTSLHPVEQVSWFDCVKVMEQLGLSLPTEAQWECAARGGMATVRWTGDDTDSLADAENIADAYGKRHGGTSWTKWEEALDDGNTTHSKVGSYRANGFGMHDLLGNVGEWCIDGYDGAFYSQGSIVDPVCSPSNRPSRSNRGGTFAIDASHARAAFRGNDAPENVGSDMGLRPAMRIAP